MKLKRKISLIFALALTLATLLSVMALNTSAATDIVVGDYGLTIPATDQSGNFIAYGQKSGESTWTKIATWGGLRSGFLTNAKSKIANGGGTYEGGTVYGYMLNNVNHTETSNFDAGLQIDGKFVFDLGGHTLTANNCSRIFGLSTNKSYLNGDTDYHTTVIIQNGTINSYKTVLDLYGSADATYTGNKTVDVIFNNVKFTSDTTSAVTIAKVRAPFAENQSATFDLTFNNCTFDFVNASSVTILDDSSANNANGAEAVTTTLNINNGSATVQAQNKLKTFNGKSDSDALNTTNFPSYNVYLADYGLTIPASDLSTGGTFYAYGQKAGQSSWTYINKWGGFRTGFLNNAKSAIANGTGAYEGGTLVGYMVKDFNHNDTTSFDAGMQIDGTFVLNLGGHKLSANKSDRIFGFSANASYLYGDTSYHTKLIVENGTIDTYRTLLDVFGSEAGTYTGNKTIEVVFNNVKFTSSSEADIILAQVRAPFGENQSVDLDVTFNNCTFDFPNAASVTIIRDNGNTANGEEAVKTNVTINGGSINTKNGSAFSYFTGKTVNDTAILDTATTLKAPSTAAAPSYDVVYTTHTAGNVNAGVEYVFVKSNEANGVTTYALKEKALATFIPKTSITLCNALIYNVYVPVSDALKSFSIDDDNYTDLATLENIVTLADGNQYYHFEIELPSAEAARDVVLKAVVNVGEKDYNGTWTMSIPKYAAKIINNANSTKVEKQLAKDVLAYVQAAYNYFVKFNTEEEIARVNALIDSILVIGGDYDGTPVSVGTTNTASPVTSVTLNLDAKPSIRFYVSDTNVTFYSNGRKLNTVSGSDENGAYVELDVYAYVLAGTITYGEDGSYHISDFLEKSQGADHENLVACFIKYVESAADYRLSIIGK